MVPLSLNALKNSMFVPENKDEDLYTNISRLPQGNVFLVTGGGVGEG